MWPSGSGMRIKEATNDDFPVEKTPLRRYLAKWLHSRLEIYTVLSDTFDFAKAMFLFTFVRSYCQYRCLNKAMSTSRLVITKSPSSVFFSVIKKLTAV